MAEKDIQKIIARIQADSKEKVDAINAEARREADAINKEAEHRIASEKAKLAEGPVVIIARTVKGKGVSFMENNVDFHGKAPNAAEVAVALKELE